MSGWPNVWLQNVKLQIVELPVVGEPIWGVLRISGVAPDTLL